MANKNQNSTKKLADLNKNKKKFAKKNLNAESELDSATKRLDSANFALDSATQKLDSAKKQKKSLKKRLKKFAKNSAIALLYALIFSLPIYANIFTYLSIDISQGKNGVFLPYLNTIFALLAVASVLKIDRKYRFYFGFFVGVLWFYWMSMSFTHSYSSITHFIPPALLLIGLIYGAVFYVVLFFNALIWRIFTLSIIGHIAIFGFDWMVVPALFSFSILKVGTLPFIFILFFVALCLHYHQKSRNAGTKEAKKRNLKKASFALIPLVFFIDFSRVEVEIPQDIFISQMDVNQQIKWLEEAQVVSERNFGVIETAIAQGKKVVILPETAFPFALNMFENISQNLLEKSRQITIITGAWNFENGKSFNSTYIFENGKVEIKNKTFLAPFGEYLPLPKFLGNIFSKITGLKYGLEEANDKINDVDSANLSFRSAICYEATKRAMYEDNPRLMIVISNNAWFAPSIEPVLQMMIIKYYARLYGTSVIHTSNGSRSMIITPNTALTPVAGI